MLVCNGGPRCHELRGVWFVDRNMNFFQLDSNFVPMRDFCNDLAPQGPTLIDGEVVLTPHYDTSSSRFHLGIGVPSYMAFDLISCNGEKLCDEPFHTREERLYQSVALAFDNGRRRFTTGSFSPDRLVYSPMYLTRKKFFPSHDFSPLLQLLQHRSSDPVYCYVERQAPPHSSVLRRYHASDGAIFVHCGPYHSPCFKWKFPSLVSLDLTVRASRHPPHRRYDLLCAGDTDAFVRLRTADDLNELFSNASDFIHSLVEERGAPSKDPCVVLEGGPGVVVEACFDRQEGQWRYMCLRRKEKPNHVTVVWQTMEQMCEDQVTLEQLVELGKATKK